MKKIIENLHEGNSSTYAKKAQGCLRDLLKLDEDLHVMKNLEKLKHIRRELHVILEVITQQTNVIKQMTDDLESGEFKDSRGFQSSSELCRRRTKRTEKLDQRREQILALDKKAADIFHDVSVLFKFCLQSFL